MAGSTTGGIMLLRLTADFGFGSQYSSIEMNTEQ
jgi:hypothetical protein